MQVFTFFSPLESIPQDEEKRLVEIWKTSWQNNGWDPVVLTMEHAKAYSTVQLERIMKSKELGRGKLPDGYAKLCHVRWLAQAYAQMSPVKFHPYQLHVDYDVINNGFSVEDFILLTDFERGVNEDRRPLMLSGYPCPCAVISSVNNVQGMIEMIIEQDVNPDRKTGELSSVCHDQAIFAANSEKFNMGRREPVCALYGSKEWYKKKLIHFANAVMRHPRSEGIKRELYA